MTQRTGLMRANYVRREGEGRTWRAVLRCAELTGEFTLPDLLERSREVVVAVAGQAIMTTINWRGCLHVLGTGPEAEALTLQPMLPADRLARCINRGAPPEFWRAVFLLLCLDWPEEKIQSHGWVSSQWLQEQLVPVPVQVAGPLMRNQFDKHL